MKTASLRILVVDDNAENARMLKVLLKGEGHEVRIAFDGPEAIEAVKLYKPDVVLLDLALLGMSGVDVATELRRIPELSACLLVAVSGCGEESLPSPSPFDRHFQKPVNLAALLGYLSRFQAGSIPPTCPAPAVA
jgi:CheY-like chemotaxis protein